MDEVKTNTEAQPTPGDVIAPGSSPVTIAPATEEAQTPPPASVQETSPASINILENQSSEPELRPQSPSDSGEGISWTGPEFAQHDKPSSWYSLSIIVALIAGGVIYLLTKDLISSITVMIAIIVLGFYNLRKPKNITYNINDSGVTIGSKRFSYEEFRSFTATIEGQYLSVTFLPLKRFAITAGLYYQGRDEEKIVDFLGDRLPREKHKPDIIDNLMQRIRF